MKRLMFLLLMMFVVSNVHALGCDAAGFLGTGQVNESFTIVVACPTCTFINFTLTSPDKVIILDNVQMTQNGNNFEYLILGSNLTESGTYFGNGGDDASPLGFCFDITRTGQQISTSQSIIYIMLLVGAVVLFFFSFVWMVNIPWGNNFDDAGKIISINDWKYVKLFLIPVNYVILMWIFGLARSISDNYLTLPGLTLFFNWAFWVMLSLSLPLVIVGLYLLIVTFINDKRIYNAIERGTPFD